MDKDTKVLAAKVLQVALLSLGISWLSVSAVYSFFLLIDLAPNTTQPFLSVISTPANLLGIALILAWGCKQINV